MTEPIQCDDPAPRPVPNRPGVGWLWVVATAFLAALASGAVVWWLQDARVQAREAARAEAAAQLEKTLGLLKVSEATAAAAAEQLKQSKVAVDAATKQAADATAQLDTVRRDASAARAERDQSKAALASARTDLDRMRSADADPGVLPPMELGKLFGSIRQVRAMTALQANGSAGGVSPAALDAALAASLAEAGLTAGAQSPYQIRLLVTVGAETPRHSVGLLMLVLRNFKVPGEGSSREVAIWGQQRTSHATDEELLSQVQSMAGDLCRELGTAMGAKPATPQPAAPASAGPASNDKRP